MRTLIGALACAAALAACSVAWAVDLEPGKPEETGLSPSAWSASVMSFSRRWIRGEFPAPCF